MNDSSHLLIHYNASFWCIRVIDDSFTPISCNITSDIYPSLDLDSDDFKFAIEKLNFFFNNVLNNAIFVQAGNEKTTNLLTGVENNIVLCPTDPTDQYLTVLLHRKMMALANGAFDTGIVDLRSEPNDGVYVTYTGEEPDILPTIEKWVPDTVFKEAWWDRNDSSTIDYKSKKVDLKVHEETYSLDFLKYGHEHQPDVIIHPRFKPKLVVDNEDDNTEE